MSYSKNCQNLTEYLQTHHNAAFSPYNDEHIAQIIDKGSRRRSITSDPRGKLKEVA
jgi:hypothetical protein